jgi:phosphoenolpyruvate-protein phosphotransferase (PTS system enzyme I)
MPIGGMIEVPAAAICADIFAHHLDFLSIGTNDLIQYIIAIDRVNDEVNYLYDPLHPAVLRLINTTLQAGKKANIPVAMCGEMAGEARFAPLLLGLGLREFSVHPAGKQRR